MNKILLVIALVNAYIAVTLATTEYNAVIAIIREGYANSEKVLSEQEKIDLDKFKQILGKSKNFDVSDPLCKIPDERLAKYVNKYLNLKAGPYAADTLTAEKFVGDCKKFLIEPCEKLRTSFKLSMALYYARLDDPKFVTILRSLRMEYDALETAGVCETLIKSTSSICEKSYCMVDRSGKFGRATKAMLDLFCYRN